MPQPEDDSAQAKQWPWLAGLAGAATVTLINEVARRLIPHAPRLDELGMRGLAKGLRKADLTPPPRRALFWLTLAGDLAANSTYYSLVGTGQASQVWQRGVLLGLAAGTGAALLPVPLGLGRGPTERSRATQCMAVSWYLVGGLTAAAVAQRFGRRR